MVSSEPQGRGSHAISSGLWLCSSWLHVPGITSAAFIPDPRHLLSDPHLATRSLGTFSVPAGSTSTLLNPSVDGRYDPRLS